MNKPLQLLLHSPKHASAAIIIGMALWHLWLAGRLNLSVDEAHYALYGLKPALSYFDHPPMVGWLNALVTHLSTQDWALRVLPALFFATSSVILYRIATRLFPEFHWVGFWTIALTQSTVMFQLLSISMLPDTPLMVASLMVFWTLLNLRDNPTFRHWLWLGVWLGIAGLSKYTAVTLVLSLFLVMMVEKRWFWLKDLGLWTAVVIAIAAISPVLIWNAQHDWISILYQLNHGTHNDEWDWLRVVQTQAAQFGVYSPLLYLAGLYMAFVGLIVETNTRLLALFALPILALFAMGSGYEMSLPHWTQLAWLFLAPLVAYWAWLHWDSANVRGFAYVSAALVVVSTLVLNTLLLSPWIPVPDNEHPARELHGWPQAIAKAEHYQTEYGNAPLFVTNWSHASRVAWYAYPQPVYITDNRFDQFDLWFGNPPKHSDGIAIVPSYEKHPPHIGRPGEFSQCKPLPALPIKHGGNTVVTYYYFYCTEFKAVAYSGWEAQLPLVQNREANQ